MTYVYMYVRTCDAQLQSNISLGEDPTKQRNFTIKQNRSQANKEGDRLIGSLLISKETRFTSNGENSELLCGLRITRHGRPEVGARGLKRAHVAGGTTETLRTNVHLNVV